MPSSPPQTMQSKEGAGCGVLLLVSALSAAGFRAGSYFTLSVAVYEALEQGNKGKIPTLEQVGRPSKKLRRKSSHAISAPPADGAAAATAALAFTTTLPRQEWLPQVSAGTSSSSKNDAQTPQTEVSSVGESALGASLQQQVALVL